MVRAIAYVYAENPMAAATLWQRIDASVRRISRFPRSGRLLAGSHPHIYREVLVYPHRLIYREASGELVVVAVVHAARDLAWSGALDPDPER
jgi:toxin ParE1/3/4